MKEKLDEEGALKAKVDEAYELGYAEGGRSTLADLYLVLSEFTNIELDPSSPSLIDDVRAYINKLEKAAEGITDVSPGDLHEARQAVQAKEDSSQQR